MKSKSIYGVVLSIAIVLGGALDAQDSTPTISISDAASRKWTSADGKFSVTGKLTAINGNQLSILCDDGKTVSVVQDKVSAADRAYIAEQIQRVSAMDANPFKASSGESAAPADASEAAPDMSELEVIDLDNAQPDADAAVRWKPQPRPALRPVRLRKESVHIRAEHVAASADDARLIVSLTDPFGDSGDEKNPAAWVCLFDLSSSKLIGKYRFPRKDMAGVDISADGKQMLVLENSRRGEGGQVLICDLASNAISPRQQWTVTRDMTFFTDMSTARFLADGHVLTEHFDKLIVWRLNPLAARFEIKKSGSWKLDRERRHALVNAEQSLVDVDLIQGSTALVEGSVGNEALAPDGTKSATVRPNVVEIADADGGNRSEFFIPVSWPDVGVRWIDDRFLQIRAPHNIHFVDTQNRVLLCSVAEVGQHRGDNSDWTIGGDIHSVVISPVAMEESAQPDLQKIAASLPAQGDDLLLFRPGDQISISVNLRSEPQQNGAVRDRLAKLLSERGVDVVEKSQWQLIATSDRTTEQVEYRRFDQPRWSDEATQAVNVTNTVTRLELRLNDEVVWSNSSSYGPGFVLMMRDGETAQQAADRQAKQRPDFWKGLSLPTYIARHAQGLAWAVYHWNGQKLTAVK